jgi:hypothetical protein
MTNDPWSGPRGWLTQLDRLLRGELTRPSALRTGSLDIPVGGLVVVGILLGLIAGACMGSYAVSHEQGTGLIQIVASAVKVPLLFGLTLLVTFPSLYVFTALMGARLQVGSILRLLVATIAVSLAVQAALGPIVAFFSVVTESYWFVVLMNVAAFATSGLLGMGFLLQTLHRLSLATPADRLAESKRTAPTASGDLTQPSMVPEPLTPGPDDPSGALEAYQGAPASQVKLVFRCWILLFGLVGAQMAWVLRPFIGYPGAPFEWFRDRQSNVVEAVLHARDRVLAG